MHFTVVLTSLLFFKQRRLLFLTVRVCALQAAKHARTLLVILLLVESSGPAKAASVVPPNGVHHRLNEFIDDSVGALELASLCVVRTVGMHFIDNFTLLVFWNCRNGLVTNNLDTVLLLCNICSLQMAQCSEINNGRFQARRNVFRKSKGLKSAVAARGYIQYGKMF